MGNRLSVAVSTPLADRVPDALADGTPDALRRDLARDLGADLLRSRAIDLVRYSSDASAYRMVPQAVVVPRNADDVARAFRFAAGRGRHITLRSAGTSLCGQSQGDDIVLDVREHFGGLQLLDDAVRVRPGTVLAHANAVLARHGRALGPDPASQSACTVGGVIANNAAGMRCTPQRSAYATLRDCVVVLPSGAIIDTSQPDAEAEFRRVAPSLAQGLLDIRSDILARPDLADRIRRKYRMRNTTGYRMSAFLDADTPLSIYRRLLVGSEGTLGFIAEATLDTFPLPRHVALWWVVVPTIDDAVRLVDRLTPLGPSAVEMTRAQSLADNARRISTLPPEWRDLGDGYAILVEFSTDELDNLAAFDAALRDGSADLPLLLPVQRFDDPAMMATSWKVRSSLSSDLATSRQPGETVVNEDVCFPVDRLAEAVPALSDLLATYGYPPAVVGHVAYGNMHFVLTPRLDTAEGRTHYARFMDDLAELVVDRFDGSLKAEHGTGINMAPYVEREWGKDLTDLMWRIRELADPHHILAPDVVLTRSGDVHLRRFRTEPPVNAEIDGCVECGFCEPVCPSRHVTTTPRQRIAILREMARQGGDSPVSKALERSFDYDGIDTCAADSMCAVACPYGIDTGRVMKQFRAERAGVVAEHVADKAARHWGTVEHIARGVVGAADVVQRAVGYRPLQFAANAARAVVDNDLLPTVPGPLPGPGTLGDHPCDTPPPATTAVYFPACINRIFGSGDTVGVPDALVELGRRAGQRLWIPSDVGDVCCGTIWSSKGFEAGRDRMSERMADALVRWSNGGELPVIVDASSCAYTLLRELGGHIDPNHGFHDVGILDATAWCAGLLDALPVTHPLDTVVVHPGCSLTKLGLDQTVVTIARHIARNVVVPAGAGCCGMAGDRGLLHPELVESATREERSTLPDADAYVASNRTCEIGLTHASGRYYEPISIVLERATRTS